MHHPTNALTLALIAATLGGAVTDDKLVGSRYCIPSKWHHINYWKRIIFALYKLLLRDYLL